ncbi:MAG: dipeptidase [Aeromicrobium erythreum]
MEVHARFAAESVVAEPAAREALRIAPVVDGHNDLAWQARDRVDYATDGFDRDRSDTFDTDLPRLRRGGVGGQFWSVFAESELVGDAAVVYTLQQVDFVHRLVEAYPDDLALAWSGDDVRAAWAQGRIASLLGAEGGHSLGTDRPLAVLRALRRLHVRYLTLTHNHNTGWADSATDEPEHGGLSDLGRDVVREMNRLGMLVDLSHVAPSTMRDALDVTSAPVVVSHSGCQAVTDHPRNVPDDVLRGIAAGGGVVMIAFVPPFVSDEQARWWQGGRLGRRPAVTVEHVVRHVEHAAEVMGVAHVGLGSDYDGFPEFPQGLGDVTGFAVLLDALAARGWSAQDLAALAGGNALRLLDAVA